MARLVQRLGQGISFVYLILMGVIVLQVVLRYGFAQGLVILEELQWHLYAVGFMFGLSYVQVQDAHIRIDLVYKRFPKKTQEWITILGICFFLIPFIILVFYHSLHFVSWSWAHSERSMSPRGLPFRWAIKAVIPISFGLLALSVQPRLMRAIRFLRNKDNNNGNG